MPLRPRLPAFSAGVPPAGRGRGGPLSSPAASCGVAQVAIFRRFPLFSAVFCRSGGPLKRDNPDSVAAATTYLAGAVFGAGQGGQEHGGQDACHGKRSVRQPCETKPPARSGRRHSGQANQRLVQRGSEGSDPGCEDLSNTRKPPSAPSISPPECCDSASEKPPAANNAHSPGGRGAA